MKELSLQNCRIDARYDIQGHLGRGSYAEIYVARDNMASVQSPHRLVVIKALNVFLQDDLDSDLERTLVENFQNEAIALDRVRHPNILSRLGHGTARDLSGTVFHYLILEFLSGGDLAKQCQGKGLPVDKAFNYLEQVCAGLAHAHKNGIIHRDIKPQNLLLTKDHEIVKIADFGVARFSQSDSPITRVGTNMYAPPEHSPIFSDTMNSMVVKELTPAADIYSLAKSAYVFITGESPRRFTNLPINGLPETFADKPWAGELLRVLNKSTQNNPGHRYQTVNEFWRDLARVKLQALAPDIEPEPQRSEESVAVPQASVSADYTSKVPGLPRFQTSQDLKFPIAEEKTPKVVIRIQNDVHAQSDVQKSILNEKNQIQFEIPPQPSTQKNSFVRRIAMFSIFLLLFAGGLFATQQYLRFGRIFPEIPNPLSRAVGVANTDVNLRKVGDVDSDKIGLVPRGSRVRVINSKDNWLEIDIIEYSRDKNDGDLDHGWVNKRYITIDQER